MRLSELQLILMFLLPAYSFADYTAIKIIPENVGVFYQNKTQQFQALGKLKSGKFEDITNQVDWYLQDNGFEDQQSAEKTAKIDQNGLATVLTSWGKVDVVACYPKGCYKPIPLPPPEKPQNPVAVYQLATLCYMSMSEDPVEQKGEYLKGLPDPLKTTWYGWPAVKHTYHVLLKNADPYINIAERLGLR